MDFIQQKFWGIFFDLAKSLMDSSFNLIADFINKPTDINMYFPTTTFLSYSYALAGGLLLLAVAWEAFKQTTNNVLPSDKKSIGKLSLQIVFAALSIYLLPWSVTHIFLKLNNILIDLIKSVGIAIDNKAMYQAMGFTSSIVNFTADFVIFSLILAISAFILGIAAAIRYWDLVINVLFAPIVAVSAVRNYEALNIWVREMIAITFTQTIHVLLLKGLAYVFANIKGPMMIITATAAIVVMMRGPKVLRQFLYSSGVGTGASTAAASAGRMAATKIMFKSMKP